MAKDLKLSPYHGGLVPTGIVNSGVVTFGIVTSGVVTAGVVTGHVGSGGHVGFGFSGSSHLHPHLQQLFTTILIAVCPFSQHTPFIASVMIIPF
ncbi:hypothetical protein [Morganella morganii]|uniref:hypothetical protein n=1 Tax=Morganella morganii TaxID=582 RepID=UPI0034E40EF8